MPSAQWFLLAIREQLGLTQQQLSRASGVTQPFISQFENGRRDPDDDEAARLAAAVARLAAAQELDRVAGELRDRERQ
jgi:transcriptional regulator with XRE-family HTH domain